MRVEEIAVLVIVVVFAVQAHPDLLYTVAAVRVHVHIHQRQHVRIRKRSWTAFRGVGLAAEMLLERPRPGFHLLAINAKNASSL